MSGSRFLHRITPRGILISLEIGTERPLTLMTESMPARILLVDDEQAVLLSHSMILESQGYTVACADTFQRAIELSSKDTFDLLICDLSLDEENSGFGVIKAALERDEDLPVILMTGYSDTELPPEYSDKRVTLLSKPTMVPDLLHVVRTLLEQNTPERHKKVADESA